MSMSDDPRGYRRGNNGNQRQPAPQGRDVDPRAASRGDARTQQRGYSNVEPAGSNTKPASFSAYRPEAYAAPDKRAAAPASGSRPDWDDGRPPSRAPGPNSANDLYPRAAPERQAPQRDSRDPYGDPYGAAPADPYAVKHSGVQPAFDSDWRGGGDYQDNTQYNNTYYDDLPQLSDAQAVHDRFFAADAEPQQAGAGRYRGMDYGDPEPAPLAPPPADNYGGQPAARGGYAPDDREYGWDSYDQAPAPQSVRPHQLPAVTRNDDFDADYFADEDEFEGEDFVEERKGGSKKLIAAVLIGAIITGGGLAFLYRTTSHSDGGAPKLVEADQRPTKGAPQGDPGGSKFQQGAGKSITDRLGGAPESEDTSSSAGATATENTETASSSSEDAPEPESVTGGTLEQRIQSALHNAQKSEGNDSGSSDDGTRTVSTMKVLPDGTFESSAAPAPASQPAARDVAIVSQPSAGRRAPAPVPADPEPVAEAPAPAAPPAPRTRLASAPPQQPTQINTATTAATGGVFVQIAARQQQDEAMAAFAILQQKYAAVLGNYTPSVRKADLADKGTWYRLWVGPMANKAEGDKLCGDLMAAGLKNCLVRVE